MSKSTTSVSNSNSVADDELLAMFDAQCKITVSQNYHPDYEIYYKGINFIMRDNLFKNRNSGYWITNGEDSTFNTEAFNTMFYSFFGQLSEYKFSIHQLAAIAQKRFQVSMDEVRAYYETKMEFFNSRKSNGNKYGLKPSNKPDFDFGEPPY